MNSLRRQIMDLRIRPKKKWGQHFVVDTRVLERIVESADLRPEDVVVEVGAGNGSLTAALADRSGRVYALEIDPALVRILKARFGQKENVTVVPIDALRFDYAGLRRQEEQKLKVVANLPYEISTPILFRFFENRQCFTRLVLMLQREVARRLVARVGTKDYGPLSLWTRLYTDASISFFVPPAAFFPRPKVDSAIVRLDMLLESRLPVPDEKFFQKVVREAFTYRRKMLANALHSGGFSHLPVGKIHEAMGRAGIDSKARGEVLPLEMFHRLSLVLKGLE